MDPAITLRHIRCFGVVAEEAHIGRAAQRLHVSQPPLTRTIRELEERLGFALIEKRGRGIRITAAGRCFASRAAEAVQGLDEAVASARRVAEGTVGEIRMGFVSTALYGPLLARLASFQQDKPEVSVLLSEQTLVDQLAGLHAGKLDVGIAIEVQGIEPLLAVPLWDEALSVCLPRRHPLARSEEALSPEGILREPMVGFPSERAPGLQKKIARALATEPDRLRFAQVAVQMQTIIGLVAAGYGLSIVPASMRNLGRSEVVYRDIAGSRERATTYLLRRSFPPPLVQKLEAALATADSEHRDASD
ncbi:LysR family transcriptional regulator [Algiphilus aromaticivorans]|jgi:DNA-binding transcriptional LysR family regulator|uniref:LysR family transcriptional regulator n=1 Tax=Algiphilus aromaticivorans TaxID=382454 RepID=UPI0006949C80|nr:LysR family transcriptional regulator [Algiphilus aromaticivorans]